MPPSPSGTSTWSGWPVISCSAHWPKAVNDDGLYPRAALTAAACLALHHLALLAWNDAPSFSDGDEALLWARFSREVEHDEANFFALAEALADLEQWPLAQIFQQ